MIVYSVLFWEKDDSEKEWHFNEGGEIETLLLEDQR